MISKIAMISIILFSCNIFASEYDNLEDIYLNMRDLELSNRRNTLRYVIGTSEGASPQDIYVFLIVKNHLLSNKLPILLTGTHHANEWLGYRVVLDTASYISGHLLDNTWDANDSRFNYFRDFKEMNISLLTDNIAILFVPVVNPAGYRFSKTIDVFPELNNANWVQEG